MTVLRTPRLVLRPEEAADLDAIHHIVSQWEVVCWTASWPWPPDRDFTEKRVKGPPPEQGMIASIVRDDVLIGVASLHHGELGYMLAPDAWGQGYATEACAALLEFGFASTDWPEITAGVFKGNDASLRVLFKLGFVVTGESVSHCRARNCDLEGLDLVCPRPDRA